MRVELVAAEPDVANPVAFCIDDQGNIYVCETFRQKQGVEDNRNHGDWLETDLSLQSVQERAAMFRRFLPDKGESYTTEHDRIRMLADTDGDGNVDRVTVFADGFNDLLDGTGAGVLAVDGEVFYTCIPKVYRLKDDDGDGKADTTEALSDGYGIRVAFRGHDMHGLVRGPAGRIYFSIGDRGYNVMTKEGLHLLRPDSGAVFRCNSDGTDLEVFAHGLRNPQELAFDDYGNLFTGDNNSDSGDKARWVHVVPGSDAGWRMYYQYLPDRGPWNREKLWHPRHEGQAAYVLPPVANLGDGPSGLTYYPGTGLPERYLGHFFMADFRGTPNRSGIRSFAVEPDGAGYRLVDSHEFLWQTLVTDVDFGPDGAVYFTDWVNGWDGLGKGRIYRAIHDDASAATKAAEVRNILREGVEDFDEARLFDLLTHRDRRLRFTAQFELVRRERLAQLVAYVSEHADVAEVTHTDPETLGVLHAVWGIGALASTIDEGLRSQLIATLLEIAEKHPAAHLKANALRMVGEQRGVDADAVARVAVHLAESNSPVVQREAALALSRLPNIESEEVVSGIVAAVKANAGTDATLRHAFSLALARQSATESLANLASDPDRSVRMGAVLALRRLKSASVAKFLADVDPLIALEAARAIYDETVQQTGPSWPTNRSGARFTEDAANRPGDLENGIPALAALASRPGLPKELLRRAVGAHHRLGARENAVAVAAVASDLDVPTDVRLEAVTLLKTWAEPSNLDPVLGAYFPLDRSSVASFVMADVLKPAMGSLLSGDEKLRAASIELASKYGITEVTPLLKQLLADVERPAPVRQAALLALQQLEADGLAGLVRSAIDSDSPELRATGRDVLADIDPNAAVALLADAFDEGTPREKQAAVRTLQEIDSPDVDELLVVWLGRLQRGDVIPEAQLDLVEAASARQSPAVKRALSSYEASRPDTPLGRYQEALSGGDAEAGAAIFFGRTSVSCRRCHKVNGDGGDVGPNLSAIGKEKDRTYLLEAIVQPNAKIAKGFETLVVATEEGNVHTGVVRSRDDEAIVLVTEKGDLITIPTDEVDDLAEGKSSMPEDLMRNLSKSDVRDLVEYLSTLKTPADETAHE